MCSDLLESMKSEQGAEIRSRRRQRLCTDAFLALVLHLESMEKIYERGVRAILRQWLSEWKHAQSITIHANDHAASVAQCRRLALKGICVQEWRCRAALLRAIDKFMGLLSSKRRWSTRQAVWAHWRAWTRRSFNLKVLVIKARRRRDAEGRLCFLVLWSHLAKQRKLARDNLVAFSVVLVRPDRVSLCFRASFSSDGSVSKYYSKYQVPFEVSSTIRTDPPCPFRRLNSGRTWRARNCV